MERGIPIRAISRSIAVLQCINLHGTVSLRDLANNVGLPYPTAHRIVQTLMHEGLVEFESSSKHYRATCLVESLSVGYREDGRLIHAAHEPMTELMRRIGWPLTISIAVGASVILRDSTYEDCALAFNRYHRGETFPVLDCAAGHVHLAYADKATLDSLLRSLEGEVACRDTLDLFRSGSLGERIRAQGYATSDRTQPTKNPGKTSSISVPVLCEERKLAQFTMSFFSSAMTMQEAVDRYLGDLHETAARIARRYVSAGGSAGFAPSSTSMGSAHASPPVAA